MFLFTGSLNVILNWKEIGAANPFAAETETVWTQTKDQGDRWIEQRIRIDNPYRNFEVCAIPAFICNIAIRCLCISYLYMIYVYVIVIPVIISYRCLCNLYIHYMYITGLIPRCCWQVTFR